MGVFLIFLLNFLLIQVFPYSSKVITCSRTTTITQPLLPDPSLFYFPEKWNETLKPSSYEDNQACSWKVWIPQSCYIYFEMKATIPTSSSLIITDTNGKKEYIMSSNLQPYIFVGVSFTIDLKVGQDGNSTFFGFKVVWNDFPTPNAAFYTVNKTTPALVFDEMLNENAVTITAETKVSLIAFPADFADFTPLLRLTLVFDGPNITSSPFLGTLYQAVRSPKPMVSSGHQLTLFTFDDNYIVGSDFVVQDYFNVQNLNEARGLTCWSNSSCPVTLNGPSSVMTLNYDGNEYLKRLDLSQDAVLKVYIGARMEGDDSNLVVSYNQTQSKTNIPQKFNGELMTYYVEQGTALLELAEDSNYTKWNDAVVGREGFISSPNFGSPFYYQSTDEYIGGLYPNDTYIFNVNVTNVDITNGSVLQIFISGQNGISEHRFSSIDNFSQPYFSEEGRNMTVAYATNNTESTGFFLYFSIGSRRTGGAMKTSSIWSVIGFLVFMSGLSLD